MNQFIFITGAGRCGTNLMLSLLDGNNRFNVIPGEATNLIADSLNKNGLSDKVYYINLNSFLNILFKELSNNYFPNLASKKKIIKKKMDKIYKKKNFLPLNKILSVIVEILFKNNNPTIINLQNENVIGLLQFFPRSKVIHMLRNPLTQINARYLFRYRYPNNYDGIEFCSSFYRNYNSFKNAFLTKNDKRVLIVKMESLTEKTKIEMLKVFRFLNTKLKPINLETTLYGKKISPKSNFMVESKIKKVSTDYSCLTPNDLYVVSRIRYVRNYYSVRKFSEKKNNFILFYLRHLGFVGKNRLKSFNIFKLIKCSIYSIYLYFLDNYYKKRFIKTENI